MWYAIRLSAIRSIVVMVALVAVQFAGQPVEAKSIVNCPLAAPAIQPLAPEWAAVRQQYETSYRPVAVRPQTASARLAAITPLAPEWVAVRQQYETSYRPVAARPQTASARMAAIQPLSPAWVAVRQQYETSYRPIAAARVQAPCGN